jgi:filamentous hemagglutinin family protein
MASILRANLNVGGPRRTLLLLGSSLAAIAIGYVAPPAQAQLLRLYPPVSPGAGASVSSGTTLLRPPTMRAALARQVNSQLRVDQIRSTAARDAAIAATRAQPTDGLSANGLDPIAAVREAIAAANGGDTTKANQLLVSVSAANDATGKNTWAGAGLPTQTVVDGKVLVSIDQNESRALLSWNRFDIGANTTLQFNQKQAGVAQPGWSVVNRVVDAIAPSTILGSMKADGTVVVLNSHGVVFGQNSQVNLHSLLVSTLEIGNAAKKIGSQYFGTSLKERNTAYLQNGLFGAATNLVDSTGTVPVSYLLAPTLAAGVVIDPQSPPAAIEGTVSVDAGANITAGNGGFIILAGPRVESAGSLNATNGQVSLQGGRYITASLSTGANDSVDPDVRGYLLRTYQLGRTDAGLSLATSADDGVVVNTGAIHSTRGYISLGASLYGSVTNGGLLSATTSVSRNGKIALNAGTVNLLGSSDPAHASGIAILADNNGEVIPQGTANEPAAFKSSKIEIGALSFPSASNASVIDLAGTLTPGVVNMGRCDGGTQGECGGRLSLAPDEQYRYRRRRDCRRQRPQGCAAFRRPQHAGHHAGQAQRTARYAQLS